MGIVRAKAMHVIVEMFVASPRDRVVRALVGLVAVLVIQAPEEKEGKTQGKGIFPGQGWNCVPMNFTCSLASWNLLLMMLSGMLLFSLQ